MKPNKLELGFEIKERLEMFSLLDEGDLTIVISSLNRDKKVKVYFSSFEAYRNIDEAYNSELWSITERYPDIGSAYYQITSKWIKNLAENPVFSCEVMDTDEGEVKHFTIVTSGDVIDVISMSERVLYQV